MRKYEFVEERENISLTAKPASIKRETGMPCRVSDHRVECMDE
jgi:hypothetical protein